VSKGNFQSRQCWRREVKKSLNRAPHSGPRMPPTTSIWCR